MTATLVRSRALAFYMALSLLILTPFQGLGTARAEVGVKTVVLGAAVGGAALFALKAMMGPASVVGSIGAAGTGAMAAVGRMAGAAMSGISSLASTLATGAMSLFSGIGSVLSTGLRGAATLVSNPYFLIPAALIGGGLLVYHFYNKSKSADGSSSPGVLSKVGGFFDRMRYKWASWRAPGYRALPYSNQYYAGMGGFYGGGAAAFQTADASYLGGFGLSGGSPSVAPAATMLGEPLMPAALGGNSLRTNLQPIDPRASAQMEADLARAEEARRTAYQGLKDALQTTGRASETGPAAPRSISNDPVIDAIRQYKDAARTVETLRSQLGK